MIIWKLLVSECLQCMKDLISEVEKNAIAVVYTNSHYKGELVGHVQQKPPWLYQRFYAYPVALWISLELGNASTREVNTYWKYQRIFIFMYLKKPLNWLKNEIINCKTLSKVKRMQLPYKKCLIWPTFECVFYKEVSSRSNVSWVQKLMSALERCPLLSVRYIKVILWGFDCQPFLWIVFALEKFPL